MRIYCSVDLNINSARGSSGRCLKNTKMSSTPQRNYHQIYNISRTWSQKLKCFLSRLAVVFVQSIEAWCQVEKEYVDGASLTGDAPTTSEWSPILLPTKVSYIRGFVVCIALCLTHPLNPVRYQAITCTNAGISWIGSMGLKFGEIWIKI